MIFYYKPIRTEKSHVHAYVHATKLISVSHKLKWGNETQTLFVLMERTKHIFSFTTYIMNA